MAHLEQQISDAYWTFGGGTVLMLRIAHRQSKDVDLFVPDPQYLGYVNPRLSDVAESISTDYEEAAEFVKLFLREGEIDVVVGTSLTDIPYETVEYRGRTIRVETSAEIMAKHGKKFLQALDHGEEVLRRQFAEIDAIGRPLDFERCVRQARTIIEPLL